MTEAEWLACTDPTPMLAFLHGKASDRKLRLVLCSCCRQIWSLFQEECARRTVEAAERLVEGLIPSKELRTVRRSILQTLADEEGWREEDFQFMLDRWEGFSFQDDASYVARMACRVAAARAISDALSVSRLRQALRSLADTQPSSRKDDRREQCRASQCGCIRELFGVLHFRPVTADPRWLTSTAAGLAQAIYAHRAFDRLPILADALEEAGCDNPDLLSHLRADGPHIRGCWALDLVLGKE